jgi:hypothetical protein
VSLTVSALVFGCVFGGALFGLVLRTALPDHHLNPDSKEVVKLGTGLVATLAALVLGLLVSSTKSSYDTKKGEVTEMSADILLLNHVLVHYGPEAKAARAALQRAVAASIDRIWTEHTSPTTLPAPGSTDADVVYQEIHQLSPANEMQRALQTEARDLCARIGRTRLMLFEQQGSSVYLPLLLALVFWLTTIFFSFGLLSPRNATVVGTLLICALSVAGAVFLILELDRPFDGIIQISDAPMRSALAHLGR